MSESEKGYIYILQPKDHAGYKIGYSKNPKGRVRSVQQDVLVPIMLVGYFPGTRADEKAIHKYFHKRRMYGEWFLPDSNMRYNVWAMLKMQCLPYYIANLVKGAEQKKYPAPPPPPPKNERVTCAQP